MWCRPRVRLLGVLVLLVYKAQVVRVYNKITGCTPLVTHCWHTLPHSYWTRRPSRNTSLTHIEYHRSQLGKELDLQYLYKIYIPSICIYNINSTLYKVTHQLIKWCQCIDEDICTWSVIYHLTMYCYHSRIESDVDKVQWGHITCKNRLASIVYSGTSYKRHSE